MEGNSPEQISQTSNQPYTQVFSQNSNQAQNQRSSENKIDNSKLNKIVGTTLVITLVLIVSISVVFAGYRFYNSTEEEAANKSQNIKKPEAYNTSSDSSESRSPDVINEPTSNEGWKLFVNNDFSLEYPPEFQTRREESDPYDQVLFYEKDNHSVEPKRSDGNMIVMYYDENNPEDCKSSRCPTIEKAENITINGNKTRKIIATSNEYKYQQIIFEKDGIYYRLNAYGEPNRNGEKKDVPKELLEIQNKMALTLVFLDDYYMNSTSDWLTYDNNSDMKFKFPVAWENLRDGAQSADKKMAIVRGGSRCADPYKTDYLQNAEIEHCELDENKNIIVANPIINHYITKMTFTYPKEDEEMALDLYYKILSTTEFYLR